MSLTKYLGVICLVACLLVGCAIVFGFYAYEVIESGELFLELAPGVVEVVREDDSKIIHVRGDDWQSIAYG